MPLIIYSNNLKNYAIEYAFAFIVKNSNPAVLHFGMGRTGTAIIDAVPK